MSLIVEDGSIVANAESLVSVSDADAYHTKFGNTAWAALDTPTKEIRLRIGTRYLGLKFRMRWQGWRASTQQIFDWPRIGVFVSDVAAYATGGHLSGMQYMVPSNVIPQEVKDAVCEAALISDELMPGLEQAIVAFKGGPVSIQWDKYSPQQKRYPIITSRLIMYLQAVGPMVKLAR